MSVAGQASRQKVLVVDDTPECIHLLLATLRDDYAVIVATDGESALRLAAKCPLPDIILLDVRMPGLDGFQVCRRLKDDRDLCDIPVIFLSQLGDSDDKVHAFRAGGVDYITKPFHPEEVRARVRTHLNLREARRELQRKGEELQQAYDQLERELRSVGDVQESLLPAGPCDIPGFRTCSYYSPARRAGGDYFNVFPLSDDRRGIFIGDVSGHGPPAAVVTAMAHVMLRLAPQPSDPDLMLSFLNRTLCDSTRPDQFMTAFYAVLDPTSRTLLYASGGHPPPLLYRGRSDEFSFCCSSDGIPLGIDPGAVYPVATLSYAPGDLFVLYTDGITEAEAPDGMMFGLDPLQEISRESCADPDMLVRTLCHRIRRFTGAADQRDDITLLVLMACGE